MRVTKTATRADEKLDLISLDEYLKKISITVLPEESEKPGEGEGDGNEGGGSEKHRIRQLDELLIDDYSLGCFSV